MHYCYRITNVNLNKHYIGVRTSDTLDVGVEYFSSSSDKNFIEDQNNNVDSYKYKVIKVFNTRKEAIAFEIKLHDKFNVGESDLFYNRSKQTSVGFDRSGVKHSIETRTKISRSHTDVPLSQKHKLAIVAGLNNPQTKKLLLGRNGKPKNWRKLLSDKLKLIHKNDSSIGETISVSLKKYHTLNPEVMSVRMVETHKNNPNIGSAISKTKIENANSLERVMLNGVYVTPIRNYVTLTKSTEISKCCTMSHSNLRRWCKNPDVKIVLQSALNNQFLSVSDVGKTRRELGFYMIYPKTELEATKLLTPIREFLGLSA